MKLATVKVYEYNELSDKAKSKVSYWLDDIPFDYENEKGEIEYEYFSEWSDEHKQEFCEINEYLFFSNGKPAHNLIEKGV